jgi:hypothetical protein
MIPESVNSFRCPSVSLTNALQSRAIAKALDD